MPDCQLCARDFGTQGTPDSYFDRCASPGAHGDRGRVNDRFYIELSVQTITFRGRWFGWTGRAGTLSSHLWIRAPARRRQPMRKLSSFGGIAVGVVVGLVAAMFYLGQPRPAGAASNDRYEDYIMCTGAVSINPRVQTDGVWLLDYRSGKLLGTLIDKTQGKIVGFAEVDLTSEFSLTPKQDVHFLMTTGFVTQGQSALYLAETATGKFGVYTMGPGPNGMGIVIRRHDMTSFR